MRGIDRDGEMITVPRIVVAGTGSGVGKTTTVVAMATAFARRGLRVATFKCGPDYLDPTYHGRATGRPCESVDGWMMGRDAVLRTVARGSRDADIAIFEGVMGLFDGASPTEETGSTAEIAKWLSAPVLLCLDASGMARTIAAFAHGFRGFDPDLHLGGLLANRVGSAGHLKLLREASPETPVLGGFPKRADLAFPERHLGLRSASAEVLPDTLLEAWAGLAREHFDLDAILALAGGAPSVAVPPAAVVGAGRARCRIGVAFDDAFHFYYGDNLGALEAAGAELVRFSPVTDPALPDVDGLYLGGGYPEARAAELAANVGMLEGIRAFAARGGPIYAECGGLMYSCEAVRTLDGVAHPMLGLVPGVAAMREKLAALGYTTVTTTRETAIGPAGTSFRGHQFRYSDLEPGEGPVERVYRMKKRRGGAEEQEGYARGSVLASYVHAHWARSPEVPAALVERCARWRAEQGGA